MVESDSQNNQGIICSESCVSVYANEECVDILKIACLIYNSKIAVYYLFLSNGFFASYRPKVTVKDLLSLPLLQKMELDLSSIRTHDEVDQVVDQLFSLKDSERVLIQDLFQYTLPDFKKGASSPGRQKNNRVPVSLFEIKEEPELTDYCSYLMRVIKAGFGEDKEICATIFQETTDEFLPVRMVAIHLGESIHERLKIEPFTSQVLLHRLNQLNDLFMREDGSVTGGIFYQRVARIYDSFEWDGEQVPTVYIVKPDKIRYWTRSMALRDADEVAGDIMRGRLNVERASRIEI